ncbi:TIGR04283 family arsenosugar biosynthesis glycosyltransferase [Salinisphaera sp. Q1T1-3]|uniref:TIGR04283 family arsenosugar biosynthesis glycosyltransferase n=1 Tax=Salinisphaera sp. Q1T1-3 TaxID=2321229 RepID=UPI000E746694|nr:TIGR04283 family arsenosugar biosynthesis glycosyltransferase [Salinisphaera sp. Q1T1-3]RJS91876.1 glycosyltransferase [Salinisphaera sp. Q1T1-3]
MTNLRIVIPAIDEAETLPGLLDDLAAQQAVDPEIVVADGGSRDATRRVCAERGVDWRPARPGRGRQMNAGAADFTGEWLLFLHADSRFSSPRQLAAALTCLEAAGPDSVGHFPLEFAIDGEPAPGFLYRFMAAKTASGRRYAINGDQGLLLRRALFEAIGGFEQHLAFLEDQRIVARIRPRARLVCLPHRLQTSARRFAVEGPMRRYALMGLIMAMYVAELDSFFDAAPGVYARQSQTRALALRPFVRLALATLEAQRPVGRAAALWRLADALRGQSWQVALALDVLCGRTDGRSRPITRCHDSVTARLPGGSIVRVVLFFVLALVVFGPAWCFRLFHRRSGLPTMAT